MTLDSQFVCLTLAPALLSASIYLCLARVVIVEGQEYSRLKPRTYSIVFVSFDFISLLLQSIGGSMTATADTKTVVDKGINVMLGGLSIQIVSLLFFMGIWLEFTIRKHRETSRAEHVGTTSSEFTLLKEHSRFKLLKIGAYLETIFFFLLLTLIGLWTAAICIFIRSNYRLAELHAGFNSNIANNEKIFMVLEGPLIIIASTALAVLHPGFGFNGQWNDATWSFRDTKSNDNKESV